MSAYECDDGSSSQMNLESLERNVKVLKKDSSRPHKQMIRRGVLLHSTGNVLYNNASTTYQEGNRSLSIIEELESAVIAGFEKHIVPSWQDQETPSDYVQQHVKLFFRNSNGDQQQVFNAVRELCCELQTAVVETLILSVNNAMNDVESFLALWQAVDVLRSQGRIKKIGVADFEAEQLEMLLSQGPKPDVVQVYLEDKQMPNPELAQLCRIHGISILAHKDFDASLENSSLLFGKAFSKRLSIEAGFSTASFSPSWVLRYHTVIPNRSIVTEKGYLVEAKYVIA